ncbi:MAG: XRE family transcriptional regulator [Desulfuromonadia bacterium]
MTDIKSELKELRLGQKIRALRQERRLTLQDLADLTGLSKPLLSQIENEQVTPPIATLLKISRGLKVEIHYFFETEGNRQKFVLTRAGELPPSRRRPKGESLEGYIYRSLAPGIRHKHIEPFMVEFEPMEWDESRFFSHEGEEFLYILDGELEFHYGDEVMTLRPGDSIYYGSTERHGFVARGESRARAVAVLYSND